MTRLVMTEAQYNFSKGWKLNGDKLIKKFTFKTYSDVIQFVNKVAILPELKNHTPDMIVKHNSVEIVFTDPKEKKVTDTCHKLANIVNSI